MRTIEFIPAAFKEYQAWIETDRRVALRIGDLIRDILRNPYEGIGKPEGLKHQFTGYWSRRIDREHRLITRQQIRRLSYFPAIHIIKKTGRPFPSLALSAGN